MLDILSNCKFEKHYVSYLKIIRVTTKLTLSIKKSIIEKAKLYAKGNNQSLSQVIESYLEKITSQYPEFGDPELDSLRGIIKLPEDFDVKKEARNIRIEKHG